MRRAPVLLVRRQLGAVPRFKTRAGADDSGASGAGRYARVERSRELTVGGGELLSLRPRPHARVGHGGGLEIWLLDSARCPRQAKSEDEDVERTGG